jgi:hypothetical protein
MPIMPTWQVTPAGIIPVGELAPRRTPGEPTTLERINALFGARLREVAPDLQRVRTLAALIATESGGHLNPMPRYEPSRRDLSFGPCQLLTSTAAGLLGHAPHPPVISMVLHSQAEALVWAAQDQNALAWRKLLENPLTAGDLAAQYLRNINMECHCNNDPIMLYAGYNAGTPHLAAHPHDKFGLVSYVHPDGRTALDSFSKWYGDACVVFPSMNTQPPPAPPPPTAAPTTPTV